MEKTEYIHHSLHDRSMDEAKMCPSCRRLIDDAVVLPICSAMDPTGHQSRAKTSDQQARQPALDSVNIRRDPDFGVLGWIDNDEWFDDG